jgi:AcrR family transcriptional regulator
MNASRLDAPAGTGRPRRSSRETLQDAATELFLEQGYEATTVDDIARRAGVSRATFFNYFPAKGDLLWAEVDPVLERLPEILSALPRSLPPAFAVRHAFAVLVERMPAAPVVLVERATIGASSDAAAAGLPRLLTVDLLLRRFLAARCGRPDGAGDTCAAAMTAAALASAVRWLDVGHDRGPLRPRVEAALAPLAATYGPLLPTA